MTLGLTNAAGKPICGARNRQGNPCGETKLYPNGRCYRHGGPSASGIASGTYRGRGYSKYLPTRLLSRFEQAMGDPERLTMAAELAVLDARLGELIRRVDTGESDATWRALRTALVDFNRANAQRAAATTTAAQDAALQAAQAAAREMHRLIEKGLADTEAWSDVLRAFNQRQRLVESERKRLIELQQVMTGEQALTFMTDLQTVVKEGLDLVPVEHRRAALLHIAQRMRALADARPRVLPSPS